jgi:hypothetical protein
VFWIGNLTENSFKQAFIIKSINSDIS